MNINRGCNNKLLLLSYNYLLTFVWWRMKEVFIIIQKNIYFQ